MSAEAQFVAAVAVFIFRDGRLLALRRSETNEAAPGAWEGISGRLEPGEQPVDAAGRETLEECGLDVRVAPHPVTAYVAKRNRDDMLVVVYRGESDAGQVVISAEHDAFAWMTLAEFARACPFAPLVRAARLAAGGE
jgi:8-oxo-dGTP diphosphatase